MPKSDFVLNLKNFLKIKVFIKNHVVIGDFNIDILDNNTISQGYLENILERVYRLCFVRITRPTTFTDYFSLFIFFQE